MGSLLATQWWFFGIYPKNLKGEEGALELIRLMIG